jgi:spore maturation protein A
MINKIWGFFIISGILYSLFTGNIEVINKEILDCTNVAFDMIIKIFPVLALWLGIMKIAETSGLLKKLSNYLTPILSKIFPEIPSGHESLSLIASNVIANMAGLGSAATPFGLKAMDSLQTLNKKKDIASRSMITFLVLNTSGVTIIPTTIISLRMLYGSSNPTKIVIPCLLATACSTIAGLTIDRIIAKKVNK